MDLAWTELTYTKITRAFPFDGIQRLVGCGSQERPSRRERLRRDEREKQASPNRKSSGQEFTWSSRGRPRFDNNNNGQSNHHSALLCFALLRFLIKIRSICPTSTGLSSMSGPSPRRLGHVNGRGTYTGLASYASFPRCLRDKGGGNPTMDPF